LGGCFLTGSRAGAIHPRVIGVENTQTKLGESKTALWRGDFKQNQTDSGKGASSLTQMKWAGCHARPFWETVVIMLGAL